MRFCLDNSVPVRHARTLNEMVKPDHSLIHVRDKLGPAIKDEDFVRALVQEGDWIVISGDHRIDRNAHLCQAWRESGLIVFFLSKAWTNISLVQQHSKLALILADIIERAEGAAAGSGFSISIAGKIEQMYP